MQLPALFRATLLTLIGLLLCSKSGLAQTKAYVTSGNSGLVTVIDTNTDAVLTTVPVGTNPMNVVISRDGLLAYVANKGSASISVLDTVSDAVVATIPVGPSPAAMAISPNGATLYVSGTNGVQAVATATGAVTNIAALTFDQSGLAISPNGSRLYAAGGANLTGATVVSVIDTATNSVIASIVPEVAPQPNVVNSPVSVAVSPDGSRLYVGVSSYFFGDFFGAGGGVAIVNTTDNTVMNYIDLFALPGKIAFGPDGKRAYVAMAAHWVTIYGGSGAYFNERVVHVIDTASQSLGASIDLGADGVAWFQQNTPSGVAVTPDGGDVYITVLRINTVALADTCTNAVRLSLPVSVAPWGIAIVPDPNAVITPCAVDAVDDLAAPISSNGGIAVANVLANDRGDGLPANLFNVTLSLVSSTNPGVSLNLANASVSVAPGTALGTHTLVYRICDKTTPTNCDQANVIVPVRAPYVVDAVSDTASSYAGRVVIPNVLSNDTFNGGAATLVNVTLSTVSSTSAGVTLNGQGAVSVAAGTPAGTQTLVYRICEKAEPINCDSATVTIQVIASAIDAVNDSGTITRVGGVVVPNVLANDTFNGAPATLGDVTLAQVSSTNAGVTLDASGAVLVTRGTATGNYTLTYRICETAVPANCDAATVAVTVNQYVIDAVNDSAAGSSKVAGTLLANVLANDTLGDAPATLANVTLSLVSLTPSNSQIRLDLTDGSVDLLGSTSSVPYSLVYRICEIGNPTNCDQATVSISLSGGGGGGSTTTTYKLSISKNGKGTVTTNPAGTSFNAGTVVTLTATPDPGQPWVGWSGACTGTSTTCTLTMNSDKSVTANFR